MAIVTIQVQKGKRISSSSKSLFGYRATRGKGVCVVRKINEKPLYKPSAGKILVYDKEKKDTDIVFKRPPKEAPVFKEEVILNVFKK